MRDVAAGPTSAAAAAHPQIASAKSRSVSAEKSFTGPELTGPALSFRRMLALQSTIGNRSVVSQLNTSPRSTTGCLKVRRSFLHTPQNATGPRDQWLDTEHNQIYEAVAWHEPGQLVTVRAMGGNLPLLVLRRTPEGHWLPSVLTEEEQSQGSAPMDDEEITGPLKYDGSPGQLTTADQADRQLLQQGMRLARLSTGFTVQVDVAPVAQGQLTDPRNALSNMVYAAADVVATGLTVGNQDRPNTYLEPKKGKSNIPQGRHTVAWSFMRQSFATLTGRSVQEILTWLLHSIDAAGALIRGEVDLPRFDGHPPSGG